MTAMQLAIILCAASFAFSALTALLLTHRANNRLRPNSTNNETNFHKGMDTDAVQ